MRSRRQRKYPSSPMMAMANSAPMAMPAMAPVGRPSLVLLPPATGEEEVVDVNGAPVGGVGGAVIVSGNARGVLLVLLEVVVAVLVSVSTGITGLGSTDTDAPRVTVVAPLVTSQKMAVNGIWPATTMVLQLGYCVDVLGGVNNLAERGCWDALPHVTPVVCPAVHREGQGRAVIEAWRRSRGYGAVAPGVRLG